MIQQKCFFHKNNVIHKFCTLKDCTLPLCKECEQIHKQEHQNKGEHPQIISYSQAYNRTLNDLESFLRRNFDSKKRIQQQLEADQVAVVKQIQKYYKQKKQQIDIQFKNLNDIQQKVVKLEKGSIKTLIYYYSGEILLKEVKIPEIRKLSKEIEQFFNNSDWDLMRQNDNIQTFRQIQRQTQILKEIERQSKINVKGNKENKFDQSTRSKQKEKQRKGIFGGHNRKPSSNIQQKQKPKSKSIQKQRSHEKTNKPYLPLQMPGTAKDNEPYLNNIREDNNIHIKQGNIINTNNNNNNNQPIGKWRKFNYQVDKIQAANNGDTERQLQRQATIKAHQNAILNLQRYPSVNELISQKQPQTQYHYQKNAFASNSNNGIYQLQSHTYSQNKTNNSNTNPSYIQPNYQLIVHQDNYAKYQQDKPYQYHYHQRTEKYGKNHLNEEDADLYVKNRPLKPADLDLDMDPLPKYAQQFDKIQRQRLERAKMFSHTTDNFDVQNRAKRTFSHTYLPHRKTQVATSITKNGSNHKQYNQQIYANTNNNLDIKKQVLSPDQIRKMLQKRIQERSKLLTNKKENPNPTTSTTNLRYSKKTLNSNINLGLNNLTKNSNSNTYYNQAVQSRPQSRSPQRGYEHGSTGYQTRNSIINQIYNQKEMRY